MLRLELSRICSFSYFVLKISRKHIFLFTEMWLKYEFRNKSESNVCPIFAKICSSLSAKIMPLCRKIATRDSREMKTYKRTGQLNRQVLFNITRELPSLNSKYAFRSEMLLTYTVFYYQTQWTATGFTFFHPPSKLNWSSVLCMYKH